MHELGVQLERGPLPVSSALWSLPADPPSDPQGRPARGAPHRLCLYCGDEEQLFRAF